MHNRLFASRVAAFITAQSGIPVDIDSSGKIGEFTVWVDGRLVEKKNRLKFPDKHGILSKVQQALDTELCN